MNRRNDRVENPLFDLSAFPRFDAITPETAMEALPALIADAQAGRVSLEQSVSPSWDGCMRPLLALTEPLEYAWGIVCHLHAVQGTPSWRSAHEALQPSVVAFYASLGQSEPVYQALCRLRNGPEWKGLDEPRRRLIASTLDRAERAGVGLSPPDRKRMRDLHESLAAAGTAFANHLLDSVKSYALTLDDPDQVTGLPASARMAASAAAVRAGHVQSTPEAGPWVITLDAPSFMPFLQYSQRCDLRETLYRAYISRASDGDRDNAPLVRRILADRQRMADLLDAGSYADLALRVRMAGSVDAVDALIARLHAAARPAAEREHAELSAFARRNGGQDPLKPWDLAYWSERLHKERFGFEDEDLRPFFSLPDVLDGLFDLSRRLFDVVIRPARDPVPVWHPDVRVFDVLNEQDERIAGFYLDPYSRPETKRGGAWMDPAGARRRDAAGRPVPSVAYLVCNQTLPVENKPARMTLPEVVTLFHEFGHALQHLLTTVEIPAASGIHNVEWDAVELASQFMEHWCWEPAVLRRLSRHAGTGEPLPDAWIGRIRDSRVFRSGSALLRQLGFAALDIELHARYRPENGEDPEAVQARLAPAYTVLAPLPEDRLLCGFQHIFSGGYAAGYYGYKWAEVMAADAFSAFREGPGTDDEAFLQARGRAFRDTILALGGSRHPLDVFHAFRGRDPDPDALLRRDGLLQ